MSVCDECPMRLFNKKHYNIKGIGNAFSGNLIVLPNVDYSAYKKGTLDFSKQVEFIKSLLGEESDIEQFYVVPLLRCNETISCEPNDDIYRRCLHFLVEDIKVYDFKNILLLGNAARRFFNISISDNIDNVFISKNNRRYNVNYSPFVVANDDKLSDTFKQGFIKWINAIMYNDFNEYKKYMIT